MKIFEGNKLGKIIKIKSGKTSYVIPKSLLKKGKKYCFSLLAKGKGKYKNSATAKSAKVTIK